MKFPIPRSEMMALMALDTPSEAGSKTFDRLKKAFDNYMVNVNISRNVNETIPSPACHVEPVNWVE